MTSLDNVSSGEPTRVEPTPVDKNKDRDEVASAPPKPAKTPWFRITVIVLFALFFAYDLFEAISDTFGVAAQITKYNENATLIGLNSVNIPWAVLVANMLLPIIALVLSVFLARKRNVGILAIVLLAGLGVVGAVSLSLTALAGVFS